MCLMCKGRGQLLARPCCEQAAAHRLMSSAAAALASSGVSFFLGALCKKNKGCSSPI